MISVLCNYSSWYPMYRSDADAHETFHVSASSRAAIGVGSISTRSQLFNSPLGMMLGMSLFALDAKGWLPPDDRASPPPIPTTTDVNASRPRTRATGQGVGSALQGPLHSRNANAGYGPSIPGLQTHPQLSTPLNNAESTPTRTATTTSHEKSESSDEVGDAVSARNQYFGLQC